MTNEVISIRKSESYPVAAGENIAAGDWVKFSGSLYPSSANGTEAQRPLVAKEDTAEDTKVAGIAVNAANNTSGSDGDLYVTVMTEGIAKVASAVEDTDAGAGYDAPIAIGDAVAIGDYAGTEAGQNVVAIGGTDTVTWGRAVVGVALEPNAGSTSANTQQDIKIEVKMK